MLEQISSDPILDIYWPNSFIWLIAVKCKKTSQKTECKPYKNYKCKLALKLPDPSNYYIKLKFHNINIPDIYHKAFPHKMDHIYKNHIYKNHVHYNSLGLYPR